MLIISWEQSIYKAFIKYTPNLNSFPGHTNEDIDTRSFATSRGDRVILFGVWRYLQKYVNILVLTSIVKKLHSQSSIAAVVKSAYQLNQKDTYWFRTISEKNCVDQKKKYHNPVVHMDEVAPNTARESVEAIAFSGCCPPWGCPKLYTHTVINYACFLSLLGNWVTWETYCIEMFQNVVDLKD